MLDNPFFHPPDPGPPPDPGSPFEPWRDFRNFFSLENRGNGDIALVYDVDPLQNLPAGDFLLIENAPASEAWTTTLSLDDMIAAGNLLIDPFA